MPPGPILDLHLRTPWKRGSLRDSPGPYLVSYTEFTPSTLRDLPAIYRAAQRLRAGCAELDGALGVTIYWQPFRRRGGSVTAWRDEGSLRHFVSLPYHLEVVRRYRDRGSLRATTWSADDFDLRSAFRQGRRALDEKEGGA